MDLLRQCTVEFKIQYYDVEIGCKSKNAAGYGNKKTSLTVATVEFVGMKNLSVK